MLVLNASEEKVGRLPCLYQPPPCHGDRSLRVEQQLNTLVCLRAWRGAAVDVGVSLHGDPAHFSIDRSSMLFEKLLLNFCFLWKDIPYLLSLCF